MSDFLDEIDEYDLNIEYDLNDVLERHGLDNFGISSNNNNFHNNNFGISSNNFDNNDHGFNTSFTFILDDNKKDDHNSILYKNHDIRTQPYEGFDNIIEKISSVDTDNLSHLNLNSTDCCFETQHEQVSGGKVVKSGGKVKKKSKKKRKMTDDVDIKEQPNRKKTRKAPFEVGSNIFKFDDCSVYKITNIYQDVGEHIWKANVEQVFPEVSDPFCTIVIDKEKYTQYNTIT